MSLPLHLMRHAEPVAFVRLPGGQDPDWEWRTGPLSSITYTDSETSVVCAFESVPDGGTAAASPRATVEDGVGTAAGARRPEYPAVTRLPRVRSPSI